MQYHYVIGFDSDNNRWWVEAEPEAYFPDGNIWDRDHANSRYHGFLGWFMAEDDSAEAKLDLELFRTLSYIVDTIPKPSEVLSG
jgi:hypothetical protein